MHGKVKGERTYFIANIENSKNVFIINRGRGIYYVPINVSLLFSFKYFTIASRFSITVAKYT